MTTPTTAAPPTRATDRTGGAAARPGPLTRLRASGTAAAVTSAVMAMAAYCLGMAAHGTYPFGQGARAVNDLRHQYVPFHAHLWDLQHGAAQGDLFFNWQSGYGNGFLAEFFTYLGNPFSWLTGLFPREDADFSVFLVSLLSIGLAAAVMTAFLGRLRPGSPWLRAVLATGYAVCGWSLIEGGIVPMWMWGLVAFPLLCLAADHCLTGRRWVLGTLYFALCWYANFYTAAMATLGAALVLLLRLAVTELPWRARVRALWRAATMTVTGLLLAAPAVTVSGLANAQSQPSDSYVVSTATEPLTYLGLFLPGSVPEPAAPNVFTGVLVLLLVLALPFQGKVRVRERIGWPLLIGLVAVSFVYTPTAKVWQGFTLPHGSPFRESFILSGLLVMAAWICLSHMPRARALVGGAALTALLVWAARDTQPANDYALRCTALGGAGTVALLLLYARGLRRTARTAVVAALAACTLATSTYAVYATHTLFDPALRGYTETTTMNALAANAHRVAVDHADWPRSRTGLAPSLFVANNDPMLLGVQGGSYYSSYVTKEAATGLRALGVGYAMGGRSLFRTDDPFFNALMGVGTLLERPGDGPEVTARTLTGLPLVSLRAPGADRTYGAPAGSVWARRNAALGAHVYDVPTFRYSHGPVDGRGPAGYALGLAESGKAWSSFTARCRPGDQAYLYAPELFGVAVGSGATEPTSSSARPPAVLMPVQPLGTVPADGTLKFAVGATRPGQVLPYDAVGCLGPKAFHGAVQAVRSAGPAQLDVGGHTVRATFAKGSRGTAVVAAPAIQGWRCSVDGGPSAPPVSYQGLLGIPLGAGASAVSCAYTPPGLNPGLAAVGVGLLVVGGVLLYPMVRRRWGVRRG
ncbi:YfhO family protein [Streptomyces sp. NRRL S-87]|uniref:YfhO family protein n=1 Tax=Streptomyces sp. NRRL S-87 TaxID=1463920 RepID=UPI00068B62A9|nr:YfhO family protein [Streptomyces sp. NRRL S-87]